ncbi:MAG: CPBP family intramembrane metalloprotease, partial [Anaerolineae bacterium]|nr:CPBP family intramembrane metalloprotease [Anaerolineae bacterium]
MMKEQRKFPYKFFVVTFAWSWLIWLPLVLIGADTFPQGKSLLALSVPISILAAFGPAVGAFYCLRTLEGKDAIRQYLRGLLDFRFGWRAWIIPVFVLGGSAWLA